MASPIANVIEARGRWPQANYWEIGHARYPQYSMNENGSFLRKVADPKTPIYFFHTHPARWRDADHARLTTIEPDCGAEPRSPIRRIRKKQYGHSVSPSLSHETSSRGAPSFAQRMFFFGGNRGTGENSRMSLPDREQDSARENSPCPGTGACASHCSNSDILPIARLCLWHRLGIGRNLWPSVDRSFAPSRVN